MEHRVISKKHRVSADVDERGERSPFKREPTAMPHPTDT